MLCRDVRRHTPGSKACSKAWNFFASIIVPQFWKYQPSLRRRNKRSMDDSDDCVYVSQRGDDRIVFVSDAARWRLREGTKLKLVRLRFRGLAVLAAAAVCVAVPGILALFGGSAHADATLEERKLPMQFSWVACQPHCGGWISAIGIVTADSPKDFENFAQGRDLRGATVVLDSSGGSVNDAITLGRRFRSLGLMTTVGTSVLTHSPQGDRAVIEPEAYC